MVAAGKSDSKKRAVRQGSAEHGAAPAAGARQKLTREEILDAALELVRKDGLARLTMRRLADALGVATMSAYRHFRNRDDLVVAIVDEVCRIRTEHPTPFDRPWQEQILSQAMNSFEVFDAYKGMPAYIIKHGPHTKHGLEILNTWVGILRGAGFDYDEAAYIFQSVSVLSGGIVELGDDDAAGGEAYSYMKDIEDSRLADLPDAARSVPYFEHSRRRIFEWSMQNLIRGLETRLREKQKK